jgi:condensin complex subunit 1
MSASFELQDELQELQDIANYDIPNEQDPNSHDPGPLLQRMPVFW